MGETLLHVEVPNGDGSVTVANRCEPVERVTNGILRRDTPATCDLPLKALLLIGEGDVMHLGVHTGVDFADSFLTADVEE